MIPPVPRRWLALAVGVVAALLSGGLRPPLGAEPPTPTRPVEFVRDVRPILETHCVRCHGQVKQKGDYRLDRAAGAIRDKIIVPGHAADSRLIRVVSGTDPELKMPPTGKPLSPAQIAVLRAWIDAGAKWPQVAENVGRVHWSLRPLLSPPIPHVQDASWGRNPIDAFIRAKLAEQGMTPTAPADRRTLIRRVTYDLTGLPPMPEEIAAFLADPAPDAYEKLVDRLLASPHYGERFARHWLDLAHYAETHGHDQDSIREHAWPYRDYLIAAFNADTPYSRFVQEQLAGDVLFPGDAQALIATGFLAAGPWDESSQKDIRDDTLDKKQAQNLDRDDMVTTAMTAFVSTTVHCARCHDHKFDPILQREYYGLQAVFAGVDRANRTYDPDPRVARRRRALLKEKAKLPAGSARLRSVEAELAALPAPRLVYVATPDFKPNGNFKPAHGCRPVSVLRRGDITQPLLPAVPGALACVPGLEARFRLAHPNDEGERRAAFARWVTDPCNVLTWRSIVNRAWGWHFGRGIVATPSDFGHMGAPPSHPELLDWLAVWFRDHGGSLKQLHRLIVTSAAYRQSSTYRPDYAAKDAENQYLWRMNRQRLDAEAVRDAVLAVSGQLDPRMGGPSDRYFTLSKGLHVTPIVHYDQFDVDSGAARRRSVYRFVFRTLPDPFMDALDCPDASQFTPVRSNSVTALQALALLNDKFMVRQCEHFAARLAKERSGLARQIERGYELALGRPPTPSETERLRAYAAKYGLANACRVLLNCNEFLFLE